MGSRLPLLLLVSLWSLYAHSEECINDLSPEATLKAIQSYRDDPVGEYADCALSVVGKFAEHSAMVLVELRPVYFPWDLGAINSEVEVKFLGAFIAGNVEYQLTHNVKENRPIEGARLQLSTYERMKEVGAIETLQGFEEWLELERNGQLNTQFEE